MYKLILVTSLLVSCSVINKRTKSTEQKRKECINYLVNKNVAFSDALKVCRRNND